MNSPTRAKKLPLHITIGSLFIALVVLLGLVLSIQSYNRSSDIILSSAEQYHEQISREVQLDFRATYRPVVRALELLALSPIVGAQTQAARMDELPLLVAALRHGGAVSAIQVGYANGDYFIVRPLNSAHTRRRFMAPAAADYVVDHIAEVPAGGRRLTRLYLDEGLGLIRQEPPVTTDYDPRQRPWYRQATAEPSATAPYLFHFIGKVGTTVTRQTAAPGVVVATDVSLEQLSETIRRYRITPGSEVAIIGGDGRVLAYHDVQRVGRHGEHGSTQLTHIRDLGSPLLQTLSDDLDLEPRRLDLMHDGRHWIGKIGGIASRSGLNLSLLLLSPVDELLTDAAAVRQASLITTAVIIVLSMPVVWWVAGRIAGPMRQLAGEAEDIRRFDFGSPLETRSFISEVDSLADAMRMMKSTINRFLVLINSLAGEKAFDALLGRITAETMHVAGADAAVAYLVDDDERHLCAEAAQTAAGKSLPVDELPDVPLSGGHPLVERLLDDQPGVVKLDGTAEGMEALGSLDDTGQAVMVTVPLRNRQDEAVGVLCLLYPADAAVVRNTEQGAQVAFVHALSGFAAVSIESRHLLKMQEALLDAFIKLIAGAIDAKSPYTGGHCQRVPELTRMLAEAACAADTPPFADFDLDDDDWDALHIASWLHDCGKVTTPEYVVDKATKLETIYDRIHEIRMRFEVLKRDAEIRYWRDLTNGGERDALKARLDAELARLDEDFAFVAECNQGGEFMDPARLERLRKIAATTWLRTLDDRIGVSWEEEQRKARTPPAELPKLERLIADKPEHLIERSEADRMPSDNPWGFRLDVPQHLYNRGELYNLAVARGTLSEEERYKINDHVVQTIVMLDKLPYPKHLRRVPEIAGGHHETMDGKGYPKRLTGDQVSVTARIMAIADIFEALTASDRPYKKAKTLSESLRILSYMKNDGHIDPDLFRLFLQSGIWKTYAEKYLLSEQIDDVDIRPFLT